MALRSLGSLVRGAIRAWTCSSLPGSAVQGALGSAAGSRVAALHDLRNLAYHVDAHHIPVAAAAAISSLAGSRGLHSRAAAQTALSVLIRSDGGGGGQGLPSVLTVAALSTLASLFVLQSGSASAEEKDDELPESIDWSARGAVTPVKHQHKCGNCYAHAVIGAIEGLHQIKTGQLVELSVQQVTDCARACSGCIGGDHFRAFLYCCDGLATSASYPQRSDLWHGICRSEGMPKPITIDGFAFSEAGEEGLMRAVSRQPVVVHIDVTPKLKDYKGGIIDHWMMPAINDPKSKFRGNHSILVVGYGTDKRTGKKFWKVKNSWGRHWGERGYARIRRGISYKNGVGGILRTRGAFPYINEKLNKGPGQPQSCSG